MTFCRQLAVPGLVVLGLCGLLAGCVSPRPADTGGDLLGTLEFRDYEVHVFAGGQYTIETHGRTLATRITREELQARFPDMYDDIETLYAKGWAGLE
ncbi:MAG: hypothetical protein JSU68_11020 [Phycisphaerales bacterium]|nr:MAG: hypothetical protein JSU68_11020 [Phycisphaerales bacterium]